MEIASFGNEWEGRVVEGRFPLLQLLGGSGNSSSFLTVLPGLQEALIQLILADGAEANAYVSQWDFAMALSHPHLAKILAAGRCVIDRRDLVYVVSERSYSTLSKIIQEGALKANSAREIFTPVLNALSYLHENGVVHGHVNPSNIQLTDLQPKLSMTDLLVAGMANRSISASGNYDAPELRHGVVTAAADTWSVGMTLWEAVTHAQPSWDPSGNEEPRIPQSLPRPFREIVRDCLRLDPLQRCTIQDVLQRLDESKSVPVSDGPNPVKIDSPLHEAAPIPASEFPVTDEPEAHSSKAERIRDEEVPEPVLFSKSLSHFEETPLSRFRIMPFIVVLLAAAALIAFLWVRTHGIPSVLTSLSVPPVSPSSPPEQSTAPAPSAANPPEPESSQPESKAQSSAPPQTETENAPAPKQPAPEPPHAADHARAAGEEAKSAIVKRVLPTISPGARDGMRRPVEVLIRVSVNREGTVADASYVWPGPGNYFARLAQRASLEWEFRPPTRHGGPGTQRLVSAVPLRKRKD